MLPVHDFPKIYLYRPFVDFRKGIKGLSMIVQDEMGINPYEKSLFLFSPRSQDRVKALFWDRTGFVLYYKVLERHRYQWPKDGLEEQLLLKRNQLEDFLQGLNPWQEKHAEIFLEKL